VLYLCGVAEKMTAPFVVRVLGRSGHASMPGIADNALVKAAPLIERLGRAELEPSLQPEVTALVETLSGRPPTDARSALETLESIDPLLAKMAEPLFSLTLSPTLISASLKRNVVPAVCELTVDCRLLPGQTPADAEAVIRAALGGDVPYELEFLDPHGGTRSPLDTPLWKVVADFVSETEPGALAVPLIVPGFTDSHWLREAFDTVAYGFFPMRTMSASLAAELIHSADERVLVEDLELGLRFLRQAAMSFADMSR
jgi:acetylornithine deacetylase/succinyl-diaminopimelate desuccinylase-like protein